MKSPTPTRKTRGFTLIEVMLSTVVMTVIVGGLFNFMQVSLGTTRLTSVLARLDQETSRAIRDIVNRLTQAGQETIAPPTITPLSTNSISFQRAIGFQDGEVVWDNPAVIEFRYDPTEADDGIDNNNNGLVDEGAVVLRIDADLATETVHTLVTGVSEFLQGEDDNGVDDNGNGLVDETGLAFDFGEAINIHLSLQRRGTDGSVFTRTLETSIDARN